MLEIELYTKEGWDEENDEFVESKLITKIQMEHSLLSVSKWEAKWHKPFLETEKSTDENISYVECMILNKNFDYELLNLLTNDDWNKIAEYINDPMTATIVPPKKSSKGNRKILTNEMIYFFMSQYGIPVEFQKWHFRRLLTLIQLCDYELQPEEEATMTKEEIMARNRKLNAERRAKYNSKG